MAKNGGNIGKGAKIGIAIALAMACCIPAVASETTTGEFVILEDPADFSDTPPLDGLDILKWTVSEPDGENLVFTITMLGDFSALEDPILDDRDYGFMIVRFIIDNTPYDKVIYPEHDGNGIVAVSSNIITLQYPYVTLSGIHLGSVLKDSYIVTRFQGTIGDLAPGGSTTTGDTNALNPGNPIFPPTEYGNEYTITMGPAIKIEADALAKKVKLNDEVEFSVGFTNTGPDNATISLRAVSSKKGWQADFDEKSVAIDGGATEYVTLVVKPPLNAMDGDSTEIVIKARASELTVSVTVDKETTPPPPPPGTGDDTTPRDPTTTTKEKSTPGFGTVLAAGGMLAAVCIVRAGRKRRV